MFDLSPMPIPTSPTVVTVTPQMAADWLENRNVAHNRNLSPNTARRYSKAMREGRWMLTHQGIAFDREGFLIDGQHRLRAIVLADVDVKMFVVPNCDHSTFAVVDNGSRRQAGQLIKTKGSAVIAAAARYLGVVDDTFDAGHVVEGILATHADTDEILQVVKAWPELTDLAPLVGVAYRTSRVQPSAHLAVLAQAARTKYAERIPSWLEGISEGVGLGPEDPRLHLRNRFVRDGGRPYSNNHGRCVAYCLITKAWNAYALDAAMKNLRSSAHESTPKVVR